jgi:hypothetical protein
VSNGRFALGIAFLFIFATQLRAQWDMDTNPSFSQMPSITACHDIAVEVKDTGGRAIMGASIGTEDSAIKMTTDTNGVASIPCEWIHGILPVLNVRASGFRPAEVSLAPDSSFHFDVTLDRTERVNRSSGYTVTAAELSADAQEKSERLQQEATKAIGRQDYENANKLLLEALDLTPSSPAVANNLGVVALRCKDLESAGSWFQKASEEAPYQPSILGNLGLVRWMQHRIDESYQVLTKAFSIGYESNLGRYILGTVSLEKGLSREAARNLKKTPPDRFPYRDLYLSIALRNFGKTKAADESYRNFLKRRPAPFYISLLLQ